MSLHEQLQIARREIVFNNAQIALIEAAKPETYTDPITGMVFDVLYPRKPYMDTDHSEIIESAQAHGIRMVPQIR